jgi:peptide/nickel transport system substrate-binding protein
MPLHLDYIGTVDNQVTDLIASYLALPNAPIAKDLGLSVALQKVDFSVLQYFMQRVGYQSIKAASMFNLATNFNSHVYDHSFNWSGDAFWQSGVGYNRSSYFYDLKSGGLDELSMKMVYGVQPGDHATFQDIWAQYVIRWNEVLPELPLYSNEYFDFYNAKLENYEVTPLWTFSRAIVYANVKGYNR